MEKEVVEKTEEKVEQKLTPAQKKLFYWRMFLMLVVIAAGIYLKVFTDHNLPSEAFFFGGAIAFIVILSVTSLIYEFKTGKRIDL